MKFSRIQFEIYRAASDIRARLRYLFCSKKGDMLASDGHMLAAVGRDLQEEDDEDGQEIAVPIDTVNAFRRTLPSKDTAVEITEEAEQVCLKSKVQAPGKKRFSEIVVTTPSADSLESPHDSDPFTCDELASVMKHLPDDAKRIDIGLGNLTTAIRIIQATRAGHPRDGDIVRLVFTQGDLVLFTLTRDRPTAVLIKSYTDIGVTKSVVWAKELFGIDEEEGK